MFTSLDDVACPQDEMRWQAVLTTSVYFIMCNASNRYFRLLDIQSYTKTFLKTHENTHQSHTKNFCSLSLSLYHCPIDTGRNFKVQRFVDSIERNPIKWRNQLVIENVVQIQCSIYAKM